MITQGLQQTANGGADRVAGVWGGDRVAGEWGG